MRVKIIALAVSTLMASTAYAVLPIIDQQTEINAKAIHSDPVMKKILQEATSEEGQLWRFKNLVELARIASPSRSEMRRQKEITRRLTEEWGFDKKDVMTQTNGHLPGAGIQKVDGKTVYNVCVRIPGTYGQHPDKKTYNGQLPKVLMEGHIDTVNPSVLPPADRPFEPVKLQLASEKVVKTRDDLKNLTDELRFDKNGKVIEDENFKKAYRRFANYEEAKKQGGYRIYVPGIDDAMINTVAIFQAATLLKKHNVKPVYDIWACGTAGEEGQGNLAGMKQLFGYNQETGKGNNALNFVADFAADDTSPEYVSVNYIGSYRFEVKYSQPSKSIDTQKPSALKAASRAVHEIAKVKSPWDLDKSKEKTTYTVGTMRCDEAKDSQASQSCTLMVDMRSDTQKPLKEIREQIEPQFQKAVDMENAKYGLKNTDKNAVKMEIVWFGDRPAYQRPNYNDAVMQSFWMASELAQIDQFKDITWEAASVNDNVPAAIGVPSVNVNLGTTASSGGNHTWYEWSIPGNGVDEGKRLYRHLLMVLTTAGFNTSDGKELPPLVSPIGSRTTSEIYK